MRLRQPTMRSMWQGLGTHRSTARRSWLSEGRGRPLIVGLDHLDAGASPLVGGKAANLGELTCRAAGAAGFCLTTEAYRRAVGRCGARRRAWRAGRHRAEDPGRWPRWRRQARELILAVAMSRPEIAAAVGAAYAATGDGRAGGGRSSATAEDLPFGQFRRAAGHLSERRGADAVLEAVRRCWASLWTDRAVAYRATNGIDHRHGAPRGGRPADGGCRRGGRPVHRQPGDRPASAGGHRREPGAGRSGGFRGGEPGPLCG